MQAEKNYLNINAQDLTYLLKKNFLSLMAAFFETQSIYLSKIHKSYGDIEMANIILVFMRSVNLQIIRQRETDLNFNFSLENFWNNMQNITMPLEKIVSIAKITNIPKETVRRKIKGLTSKGFLINKKNFKSYYFNIPLKDKEAYFKIINEEIKILSKFTFKFASNLGLDLDLKLIEQEIKLKFSFYWYHFLSCQLNWLNMWQTKLKDNDLLLIILQTVIPTLQYVDKLHLKNAKLENIFELIGKIGNDYNFSDAAVSATSISEITGIPRSTCIRKLDKLVKLKFLLREIKTKRYFISQNLTDRTKNILTKENVSYTINIFSKYLSIILTNLLFSGKNVD